MKNEVYQNKLDQEGNPIIENGDFVMELVSSKVVYAFNSVEDYKKYLIDIIDEKTSESIALGFNFEGNIFSMSTNAQINWSNLLNIPEQLFPLQVSTKDNEVYMLALANRLNFYLTALGTKKARLDAGNALKQQVKLLTTLQECEDFEQSL
jgi:hypothetical protein